MWSWLHSAEFNKAKGSVGERLMGPPVTLKMGNAVEEGGALSSAALKLLFIQLQIEDRCPQENQFPRRMRKYNVTKLLEHYFSM